MSRRISRGNGESTPKEKPDDTFWALKDVSFKIQPGEMVGVIGRNGAGKSTLLKILSRITQPTDGHVQLRGRLGSLLEVGTGFHPELSGRENIYLYGAILGMSRSEITRRFDEIVAFAETERFVDTPVKRYSSGMYVRLAFSVAAHLNPHILLVDEVLSVGDLSFQRKCVDHLKRLRQTNTTVILVSHNMFAVKAMCERCIYLSAGYKETWANAVTDSTNPSVWTGVWGDPRFSPPTDGGSPTNALTGSIFGINSTPDSDGESLQVPYADADLQLWRNTSVAALKPGQTATLGQNIIGYEADLNVDNGFQPAGLINLSATPVNSPQVLEDYGSISGPKAVTQTMTLYRAASGALVFNSATVQWAWGLDGNHDGSR